MILAKHNSYKKIAVGILTITIIFSFIRPATGTDAGEFQKVEPNKVPDELAMLAAVTRANYEKIKTWQGKISFESMIIYRGKDAADQLERHASIKSIKEPNELASKAEGTWDFKIDLEKNLSFRSLNRPKPMEYIDLDTGLSYTSREGSYEMKEIVVGEYKFKSSPYTKKKDGTILSRLAEKQHNDSRIVIGSSDPRSCFNIGKEVWVLLSEFSEYIRRYNQDPNGAVGTVPNSFFSEVVLEKTQTAKGVIYRMLMKFPGLVPSEKIIFDGEKGFNVTYFETKNELGIKEAEVTTDFIEIQGVFLPSVVRMVRYDPIDSRLRVEETLTFTDMQVNIVLPENVFSINNLGLCDGDKFVDHIEGKEYRYHDANLVPITDAEK